MGFDEQTDDAMHDRQRRAWRTIFGEDPRNVGSEPDYRFSFANERTFLAWIRTALALIAGGLGVETVLPEFGGRKELGLLLLVLGMAVAATSYRRWSRNERALRTGSPLPPSNLPSLLAIGVAAVGLAAAAIILFAE